MIRFMACFFLIALFFLISCNGPTEFSSSEGGFRVTMPDVPQERVITGDASNGGLTMHMYALDSGPFTYFVAYADYKNVGSKAAELTNALKNALLKNSNATLQTENEVYIEGKRGIEASMQNEKGRFIKERILIVGNRAFQIAVYTDTQHANASEVDSFLQSFHLRSQEGPSVRNIYEGAITLLIPIAWTLGFFALLFAIYRKYKFNPHSNKWPLLVPIASLSAGMLSIPFFLRVLPKITHHSAMHYYPHLKLCAGLLFLFGLVSAAYLARKYAPPSITFLQPR